MRLNGDDVSSRADALLIKSPQQLGAQTITLQWLLLLLLTTLVIDDVGGVGRLVDELRVDERRTGCSQRNDLVIGAENGLEFGALAVNGDVVGGCDKHQRRALR